MISAHMIREARLRAGLTQADLARRAGKAASAIGRWERGEVRPALETVVELVRAAGFDIDFSIVPGDDHDRALIRRCLAQPPAERVSDLVRAIGKLDSMLTAGA